MVGKWPAVATAKSLAEAGHLPTTLTPLPGLTRRKKPAKAFLRKPLKGRERVALTNPTGWLCEILSNSAGAMLAAEAPNCVCDASACVAKLHQTRLDLLKLNCAA